MSTVDEGWRVSGRMATMLGQRGDAALCDALEMLLAAFHLRSAVLRSAAPGAELWAVAGDVVHALPAMRPAGPPAASTSPPVSVELPVRGAAGREIAQLTLVGVRPAQLPALRNAVAVLGLALLAAPPTPVASPAPSTAQALELLEAAEADRDDVADLLHDGAVQALVAARYVCDAAVRGTDPHGTDPRAAVHRADVDAARDAVQVALVALRRSLWHLRSRAAGPGELGSALEALSRQLSDGGRPPLGLLLDGAALTGLQGPAATTIYRLVQAVALPAASGPVRIVLRRRGDSLRLDLEGGVALPSPDRWQRRAHALGALLTVVPDGLRLIVPVPLATRTALRPKVTQ